MKRWWLRQEKGEIAAPDLASELDGYWHPQPAETLLAVEHRKRLLDRIRQTTALSKPHFDHLYLNPIQRYASLVQLLPASENHHHAYPGGMLDHGLELVACSLQLRQSYLLPSGAAPEDQAAQADAWSAAIAYGALLHDIGKIAVDLQVEYQNGTIWHPWHGPLNQRYRFRYSVGRNYQLHAAAAGLLYTQILSSPLLDWLCRYPILWRNLIFLLANHYEHAGTLGELVLQADRVSTAQNIGANPNKALQAPVRSLQNHLLTGLRHLVKHELKLNQRGAVGWLTEEHLWLVSKTATDKLRAYLVAQFVDGIPSSNIAMFDELQSHGLVDATPDGKAVWRATISDGDWREQFSFLRLQPTMIWADETRPEPFSGRVSITLPIQETKEAISEITGDCNHTSSDCKIPPSEYLPDDSDYLEKFIDILESRVSASEHPPHKPTTPEASTDSSADAFVDWIRKGVLSRHLIINVRRAQIHTIEGKFFLVTPGIFQRYITEIESFKTENEKDEAWKQLQRRFEHLGLHKKRANGHNIWTCTVKGPRKASHLNGYLLLSNDIISDMQPPDNPFLELNL